MTAAETTTTPHGELVLPVLVQVMRTGGACASSTCRSAGVLLLQLIRNTERCTQEELPMVRAAPSKTKLSDVWAQVECVLQRLLRDIAEVLLHRYGSPEKLSGQDRPLRPGAASAHLLSVCRQRHCSFWISAVRQSLVTERLCSCRILRSLVGRASPCKYALLRIQLD